MSLIWLYVNIVMHILILDMFDKMATIATLSFTDPRLIAKEQQLIP